VHGVADQRIGVGPLTSLEQTETSGPAYVAEEKAIAVIYDALATPGQSRNFYLCDLGRFV
jgi:hypothetical protein